MPLLICLIPAVLRIMGVDYSFTIDDNKEEKEK